MFRKRNLIALLMAAMLSLGTIGVAFADGDSGSDYVPTPHTINQPVQDGDSGSDYVPAPQTTDQVSVWA